MQDLTIKVDNSAEWFSIPEAQVRICPEYERNPSGAAEESHWGLIFAPDELLQTNPNLAAFGFRLKLAYEKSLNCTLHVTCIEPLSVEKDHDFGRKSYRTRAIADRTKNRTLTATGRCLNPIMSPGRLQYTIVTHWGTSGCPVWTMYNGSPTVLAIQ
jgi:hypothetical protein